MSRLMIRVLFNSGVEKLIEVEQAKILTDEEMQKSITGLRDYVASAFKEDINGNLTVNFEKFSTRAIAIRLKDVSMVDVFEEEIA